MRHIAATRAAWGLERVREIDAQRPIGAGDLAANAATGRNLNLWNRELLVKAFGQLQAVLDAHGELGHELCAASRANFGVSMGTAVVLAWG